MRRYYDRRKRELSSRISGPEEQKKIRIVNGVLRAKKRD